MVTILLILQQHTRFVKKSDDVTVKPSHLTLHLLLANSTRMDSYRFQFNSQQFYCHANLHRKEGAEDDGNKTV